jgi:hypothetical protein
MNSAEDKMVESWIQNPCSELILTDIEPMFGMSNVELIVQKALGINSRFFLLAVQSVLLENNLTKDWEYNRYWADWAILASFLCVMSEEDLRMYLSLY